MFFKINYNRYTICTRYSYIFKYLHYNYTSLRIKGLNLSEYFQSMRMSGLRNYKLIEFLSFFYKRNVCTKENDLCIFKIEVFLVTIEFIMHFSFKHIVHS